MPEKKPLVVTFTKMNGAGNDFIVFDNRFLHFTGEELAAFARRFCPRRTGVGADGLLALDEPGEDGQDYRMRYRNADGSRAGLCGNGARCLARFARDAGLGERGSGGEREGGSAEEEPTAVETVTLRTDGLAERLPGPVSFVNTGTEHAVLFVDDAAEVPLADWGPRIRGDAAFAPEGANANVVEVERAGDTEARLVVRTFEKGVEGETLACGTGALAAAVVAWCTGRVAGPPVAVEMPGGLLRVGFRAGEDRDAPVEDLYLEGPAETTFQGTVEMPTGA
ncbi:MAG: diaminopimelate epimerase [Bacteroidetes bacterium QH_8_67_23]|nr:MAG: diaminopimelate epimerase [Bacteroidetes bacterium QH_8_67_23]